MASEEHFRSTLSQPSTHHRSTIELFSSKSMTVSQTPAESRSDSFPDYKVGTETILFVEDLELLRSVIADSLEQLGYTVLTASSGEDALTISANCREEIHLLLTDVLMPQMKGPELARRIQAERPHIKIIYISGHADGVLAPHGVLEPGTVLLHKPFTIKILAAKLREMLDR